MRLAANNLIQQSALTLTAPAAQRRLVKLTPTNLVLAGIIIVLTYPRWSWYCWMVRHTLCVSQNAYVLAGVPYWTHFVG